MANAPESKFINDLLLLAQDPKSATLLDVLQEDEVEGLYNRAEQVLANSKAVTKLMPSYDGMGSDNWVPREIRERVLPYKSEYGECELVLTNVRRSNPKQQPNLIAMELRQPGQSASARYSPGSLLFEFRGVSFPHGPVTDNQTVSELLNMFEGSIAEQ